MSTSKGLTEIGQDGFARSRMLEGKWMTDNSNNELILWNFVCRKRSVLQLILWFCRRFHDALDFLK